jgi:uncharacterized protein
VNSVSRSRAAGCFFIAAAYFIVADRCARLASAALVSGDLHPLVLQIMRFGLFLAGFLCMGRLLNNQSYPLSAMGFDRRTDWGKQLAVGLALGWGMAVVILLPIALSGGLDFTFLTAGRMWVLLLVEVLALAFAVLAREVAFRGYPFQRLVDAVGPGLAVTAVCALFAFLQLRSAWTSRAALLSTIALQILLCVSYLRTRALWLPIGIHFSWIFATSILFGLPIDGYSRFSTVIVASTIGPDLVSGGYYGPSASIFAPVVLLLGIAVVVRLTHRDIIDSIIPGGMVVDIESHSGTTNPAPAHAAPAATAHESKPTLVQILSSPPPPSDPNPPRS